MSGYGSERKGGVFRKLVITVLLLFSILIISYVAYKLFFMSRSVCTGDRGV